jgi:serine/threonine protein kinase
MPIREEILDLLIRWEDARAAGLDPSPKELCRDQPELVDEFVSAARKLSHMRWLGDAVVEETRESASAMAGERAPEPPRLLAARYRLDALKGEGGFGRVYQGFDTWLERRVAIKIPRPERAFAGGEVDQCRREARKVAQFRHPGIVPVHDVGREGAECFIVSEWIESRNLADVIANDHPSPWESARIVAEVAEALALAHQHGLIHRDIKPANILVDDQGRACLTDFGIALSEAYPLEDVSTAGTLPYMAPEQLMEDISSIDHRADIFALGVVFFELLTGQRPFRAATPHELRAQIVDEAVPPPSALNKGVPSTLDAICLRSLAKRPDDRHQEAGHLAEEIRQSLEK